MDGGWHDSRWIGHRNRKLAVMSYARAVCRVAEVLTHAEYSADRWKDRL